MKYPIIVSLLAFCFSTAFAEPSKPAIDLAEKIGVRELVRKLPTNGGWNTEWNGINGDTPEVAKQREEARLRVLKKFDEDTLLMIIASEIDAKYSKEEINEMTDLWKQPGMKRFVKSFCSFDSSMHTALFDFLSQRAIALSETEDPRRKEFKTEPNQAPEK